MRLSVWEHAASQGLRRIGLDSIRNKMLAFALLATLIPSLSTVWISYTQNKRALTAKVTGDLKTGSTQTAREVELWSKDRVSELRVFTSSYEVTENLDRFSRTGGGPAQRRLNDYLNSVREHFVDYEELFVVGPEGRPVASSARAPRPVRLPADWLHQLRTDNSAVGKAYWDSAAGKPVIVFAVPIILANGRFLGALAAKLNLQTVQRALRRALVGQPGQAYLVTTEGALVVTPTGSDPSQMSTRLEHATIANLLARQGEALRYEDFTQTPVLGTLRAVPRLDWAVVAEIPTAEAFQQVARLRNETLLILAVLIVGIGLLAYGIVLLIVRPLNRLTRGAALVAAGHLDVDLPEVSGGEVGYLTQVFNNMVTRLREGREELQRMSLTDALTGLANRRQLEAMLDSEVRRSRRLKHDFSVMMLDVDNFKAYNDEHGHPAGDDVLQRLAGILRESTREVDCVARYGGEEFLAVLPESDIAAAEEVAERIRKHLADEEFTGGKVTVSIGLAEFPEHGDSPEALVAVADVALYAAKNDGRNRVVAAPRRRARETKGSAG
jgi:diguanylate cyclase (GGDEF)-like protein